MGVMHRDLNPENFLFSTKDKALTLKAVDFRFSVFIEEGAVLVALLVFVYVQFYQYIFSFVFD